MSEILIDVQHLDKQYLKQRVIKDVSFQIREGMICGLIGPKGNFGEFSAPKHGCLK